MGLRISKVDPTGRMSCEARL